MIKVKGQAQLLRRLAAVVPKAEKMMEKKVLPAAAEPLLDAIRAEVPIDEGDLYRSLRIVLSEGRAIIVTDEEHALPVEYGTSVQPGHPYARPGMDRSKKAVHKKAAQTAKRNFRDLV